MSSLLDHLFHDADVDAIFGDVATVRQLLDVEAALASSAAQLGLVPTEAAAAIRSAAVLERLDRPRLAADAGRDGNVAIPLVRQLRELVGPANAGWVHWGATSQDILDTALVLQLRRAIGLITTRARRSADTAFDFARQHHATPIAGRTWLQHATPTSFGLIMAGLGDALRRSAGRLERTMAAASILQLGGAAGTLAAFQGRGLELAEALGRTLGLVVPPVPWHAHRDRLVDVGMALAILAGVHGKLGRDVSLLSQTEIGEVMEGNPSGSSAMPQKQNPVRSSVAIAAAVRAPGLAATLLAALPQEHQRSVGLWPAEWATLPELVRLVGGSARAVEELLAGLVVNTERMRTNLGAGGDFLFAEALATALGAPLGPTQARDLVTQLVEEARRRRQPLRATAQADASVRKHLGPAELDRVFDPAQQMGEASQLIARANRSSHA